MLKNVVELIHEKGYSIVNVDCTVILEAPKVNPHIVDMQTILAAILQIDRDAVSLKATTHEKVDSFGEGKAIKAYAVCLINK